MRRSRARLGTVLLVAVGLAAVLATLAVTLILRMRGDARESSAVLAVAQNRIMLSAALAYLQESSRLGWDGVSGTVGATGDTFGWTDLRDGALGPRGARPGTVNADGANLDPTPVNTVPTWWTKLYGPSGTTGVTRSYQPYFSSADESNAGVFPAPSVRRWPLPGSVVRCDMPVWQIPPYAIKPIYAANPIRPPVPYGDATWNATWTATNGINGTWLPDIFNANQGALGMLDPQPVQDTWATSVTGDATLRPLTRAVAWFRVYRELLSDHDNNTANDVDYQVLAGKAATGISCDTVAMYDPSDTSSKPPLRNYSVFIITCGAGPSRGYRFWSLLPNDPRRALEPVTAQESGLFASEWMFTMARQEDVVTWFRVEHTAAALSNSTEWLRGTVPNTNWSASDPYPWMLTINNINQVPGFAGSGHHDKSGPSAAMAEQRAALFQNGQQTVPSSNQSARLNMAIHVSQGGGFRWIQRLAQEPIKW
jgi:hypothetical protein